MAVNTSIGSVGVAIQADDRTRAERPTYAHGLTGGSPINVSRTISSVSVACGTRADTDGYVESIEYSPSFTTLGYADAMALYYLAVLGDIVSTPLENGTHQHVITMGTHGLVSLSIWGQEGDDGFAVTSGVKVNELNAEFSGNEPLHFTINGMGRDLEFLDESPFEGVDVSCFDGYFRPTDGVFKIDTAGDRLAEAVITGGNVNISNNAEGFKGLGQTGFASVNEKKLTVAPSFTVVPDDFRMYRKLITGSETGTRPSGSIVYGSYYCKFTHSSNPNLSITIEGHRVPFTCELPEVDPDGDGGEFTFSADSSYSGKDDASPVIVTIVNEVPRYVDPNPPASVPAPKKSGELFGVDVSTLGDFEVDVLNRTIEGVATKATVPDFNGKGKAQEGYFAPLTIDPWEGVKVTSSRNPKREVELEGDGDILVLLGNDAPDGAMKLTVKDADGTANEYTVSVTAAE